MVYDTFWYLYSLAVHPTLLNLSCLHPVSRGPDPQRRGQHVLQNGQADFLSVQWQNEQTTAFHSQWYWNASHHITSKLLHISVYDISPIIQNITEIVIGIHISIFLIEIKIWILISNLHLFGKYYSVKWTFCIFYHLKSDRQLNSDGTNYCITLDWEYRLNITHFAQDLAICQTYPCDKTNKNKLNGVNLPQLCLDVRWTKQTPQESARRAWRLQLPRTTLQIVQKAQLFRWFSSLYAYFISLEPNLQVLSASLVSTICGSVQTNSS